MIYRKYGGKAGTMSVSETDSEYEWTNIETRKGKMKILKLPELYEAVSDRLSFHNIDCKKMKNGKIKVTDMNSKEVSRLSVKNVFRLYHALAKEAPKGTQDYDVLMQVKLFLWS